MWQRQVFVLIVFVFTKISAQQRQEIKRFNGGTPGGVNSYSSYISTAAATNNNNNNNNNNVNSFSDNNIKQQQDAWVPSLTHNNWIILQAATATASASNDKDKQQQQSQARQPISYYAYNQRYNQSSRINGNYKQAVKAAATSIATPISSKVPYVLTFSNSLRGNDMLLTQRKQSPLPALSSTSNNDTYTKNIFSKENISRQFVDAFMPENTLRQPEAALSPLLTDDNSIDDGKHIAASSQQAQTLKPFGSTTAAVNVAAASVDDAHLNEFLVPFGNVLDKVRTFCDIVKQIISDDDNDNDFDEDDNENEVSFDDEKSVSSNHNLNVINEQHKSTTTTAKTAKSNEVQGRTAEDARSSTSTATTTTTTALIWPNSLLSNTAAAWVSTPKSTKTSLSTGLSSYAGNGRKVKKLKKKFQKLLLPLLIAYKLKFLTLIPVLIGGLTLLVGSTGLAGFFFALFTAVMSLKSSGGSKSIVIKKI